MSAIGSTPSATSSAVASRTGPQRVGLIAGWGRYPIVVAEALAASGAEVYCLGIKDHADPVLAEICHRFDWIGLGKVGGVIRYFRRHGVSQVTMAGKVHKVLLYRRFISPLVNMGSLFLAPLGGLLLLLATGQALSLPVFIGVLMLFGIVAKNSILLIDFAIEEMAKGTPKLDAIIEAGHKRAQPIVMTTVAMIAGMIPTAVSMGGDAGWRAPMGIVVIGGLALSTMLTLLLVPAGFSLADGLEKRVGPWIGRRVLSYDPREAAREQRTHAAGEAFPAE